ncbi:MAG: Na/Pi symporter [Bacillota bacterium]
MANTLLLIISGLVLLITGLRLLQSGLLVISGKGLKSAFRSTSGSPVRASLSGLIASALTQSSTAVSVMTIALTHSRILNLEQAVAVILGANVGTTLTVQFLAVNPGLLALPLFAAGIALSCSPLKTLGKITAGIGAVFLGLDFLNRAVMPLQHEPWFTAGLAYAGGNHLLAVGGATLLTAFLHSSSAATGIVIALYDRNAISLDAAFALVLGNNIGTCFTALIASLTSCAAGRRVALAHLLINVIGAAVCLPFVHPFSTLVAATAADPGRQVANAHTIYNIASSVMFFPFCGPFARLLNRLVPGNLTQTSRNQNFSPQRHRVHREQKYND